MKERDLIEQIRRLAQSNSQGLLQGIGDDCAVIEKDSETVWLLTMDTLIESVHFDCTWHPAGQLGQKALSVNVSDIAAMGGSPVFVLLSLGVPAEHSEQWITAFNEGFTAACRDYGCVLIGGDTVRSPRGVTLTITVIGEMKKKQVVFRRGAEVGDSLWVSGQLGSAAAGLDLFRSGNRLETDGLQPLRDAHLNPRARVQLAERLAAEHLVHSMMDLSDGLATDLSHLCARSGVGARVNAGQLPYHAALPSAAALLGRKQLAWMISGGEDYELLFTASPADREQLLQISADQNVMLSCVGTVVEGQGVTLLRSDDAARGVFEQDISYQGYDHFAEK